MFSVDNDYIYYIQPNDNNKLYRMKLEGSDKELVIDKEIGTFNISEGSIYFTDMANDFSLFKVEIDEEGISEISSHSIGDIDVIDSCIYGQDLYKETQYYFYDSKGTELVLMNN